MRINFNTKKRVMCGLMHGLYAKSSLCRCIFIFEKHKVGGDTKIVMIDALHRKIQYFFMEKISVGV